MREWKTPRIEADLSFERELVALLGEKFPWRHWSTSTNFGGIGLYYRPSSNYMAWSALVQCRLPPREVSIVEDYLESLGVTVLACRFTRRWKSDHIECCGLVIHW